MNLREGSRYAAAISASLGLVWVCGWLSGKIYPVDYLAQPAYRVAGAPESAVDLAALHRRWPQALDSQADRVRLIGYMRDMPTEIASLATDGAAAAQAVPQVPIALDTRLAHADLAQGERISRQCIACHSFESGGASRLGPNLWNIVGSPPGQVAGFTYSPALRAKGGTWTFDELDRFLAAPAEEVPGTRMTYAGLRDQQQRADLIAHLNTLSDSPRPLPQAPPAPDSDAAGAEAATESAAAPGEVAPDSQ